jgi:hypothetical protein
MSSWDDYRLTCFHGVREGLDSHSCLTCQEIARADGKDMTDGKTYIYQSVPLSFDAALSNQPHD